MNEPTIVEVSATKTDGFVPALGSLRGIAALSVALFHCFPHFQPPGMTWPLPTVWSISDFDVLFGRLILVPFNGEAAVSLFFVLSGFVLAKSYKRRPLSIGSVASFVVDRVLRIYPALFVNLLLAVAVNFFVAGLLLGFPAKGWSEITDNFLLQSSSLNGVTWTLACEMAVIPYLIVGFAVARMLGFLGIVALTALSIVALLHGTVLSGVVIGWLFMFYCGVAVAHLPWVKWSRPVAMITGTAAILALLFASLIFGYGETTSRYVEGAASSVLIASIVYGPRWRIHQVLDIPALQSLGRISYSFYLSHGVTLFAIIPILLNWYRTTLSYPILSGVVVAVVSISASVILGTLSYRFIECAPWKRWAQSFVPAAPVANTSGGADVSSLN